MAKVKTSFFCQNCGAQAPQWAGKCSSCNEWNTLVEEVIEKTSNGKVPYSSNSDKRVAKPQKIDDIKHEKEDRIPLSDNELNRVLGGGIVPGSLILIGGEPGIGKSTLLLKTA